MASQSTKFVTDHTTCSIASILSYFKISKIGVRLALNGNKEQVLKNCRGDRLLWRIRASQFDLFAKVLSWQTSCIATSVPDIFAFALAYEHREIQREREREREREIEWIYPLSHSISSCSIIVQHDKYFEYIFRTLTL